MTLPLEILVGLDTMLNVISPAVLLSTSVAVRVVVIVPPSLPLPLTLFATGATANKNDTLIKQMRQMNKRTEL